MFSQDVLGRFQPTTESGLALCTLPEYTRTFAPIAHRELWAHLLDELAASGHPLVDTPEILISQDGLTWLGGLYVRGGDDYTIPQTDYQGHYRHQVVVKNTNTHHGCLRLAAGASVYVCSNGVIHGANNLVCRHKVSLDWRTAVRDFCADLQKHYQHLSRSAQTLMATDLSDEQAAYRLLEGRRKQRIPTRILDGAWSRWRDPPHEEFQARNAWSLYNAVTEAAKTSSPAAQWRALQLV